MIRDNNEAYHAKQGAASVFSRHADPFSFSFVRRQSGLDELAGEPSSARVVDSQGYNQVQDYTSFFCLRCRDHFCRQVYRLCARRGAEGEANDAPRIMRKNAKDQEERTTPSAKRFHPPS